MGCGKLHVRAYYDQIVATVSEKAFQALREEYEHHVDRFNVQFPLMSFVTIQKRQRNKDRVLVKVRRPSREEFVEPMRVFSNMFVPKMIKLEFGENGVVESDNLGGKFNPETAF